MSDTLNFIQELIDLDLGMWQIEKIVDIEEVGDKKGAFEVNSETKERVGRRFERQENYYIWQITQFEDSYYGNVLYPCEGRWLLISYEC